MADSANQIQNQKMELEPSEEMVVQTGLPKEPPQASFSGTVSDAGGLRTQAPDIYRALLQSIAWSCCQDQRRAEENRKKRGRELQR